MVQRRCKLNRHGGLVGLVGKLRPRYRSKTQELSFVCHFFQGLLVFLICTKTRTHSKTRRNKGDVEVLVHWELPTNGKS